MWKSLNNLHHANLCVGDNEAVEEALHKFFQSEGIKLLGSPDFFVYREPLFGIDEARMLSNSSSRKSFSSWVIGLSFLRLRQQYLLDS